MPEKKKIKVKRKKRKLKVKRIIICLLVLISLVLLFLYIKKLPIKNIYIVGNNILSDKEIIEEAGISNYPSFLATSSSTIKKKLLKNNYIKEVNIKKNCGTAHWELCRSKSFEDAMVLTFRYLMFVVHFLRRHFVYQCAAVHDGSMVDVVL